MANPEKKTPDTAHEVAVLNLADYRFNSNCFHIDPYSTILPVQQDTGIFPERHDNYRVYNIGRTDVYAELLYGTAFGWIGPVTMKTIAPGENTILDNLGRPYYITGIKIHNRTDKRAIVHASLETKGYIQFVPKEPGSFDIDLNNLFKKLFAIGVKYVPYVGSALSGLVTAFWPENKPNVWEEVKDKVQTLIEQRILEIITGILDGDIRYYQRRIKTLISEIENNENVASHYINIAQDFVGIESKFSFSSGTTNYRHINYILLPLYSNLILMKITFYCIGITRSAQLGLTDENVSAIRRYASETLQGASGANSYINDMYKERVDNGYNTFFPEDIYNTMMNVRTYIAVHGLEYIPIWNNMLSNPSSEGLAYVDVISYSQFYGRQTPNLNREAARSDVVQPLTPKLIDGKRNKITSIILYMWRINRGTSSQGPPKIGGMKITFENNDSYNIGTVSDETQRINFNGAYLTKLKAMGSGAIDRFEFTFSDGRVVGHGTDESHGNSTVFELKDHYIASIYLASDNRALGGQAVNVSVSYHLSSKKST